MRARLTKMQMQMLLDGKELTNVRQRFKIQQGESEVRSILQMAVDDPRFLKLFAVFLDFSNNQIVVEER